jgi:hypothetical protein
MSSIASKHHDARVMQIDRHLHYVPEHYDNKPVEQPCRTAPLRWR